MSQIRVGSLFIWWSRTSQLWTDDFQSRWTKFFSGASSRSFTVKNLRLCQDITDYLTFSRRNFFRWNSVESWILRIYRFWSHFLERHRHTSIEFAFEAAAALAVRRKLVGLILVMRCLTLGHAYAHLGDFQMVRQALFVQYFVRDWWDVRGQRVFLRDDVHTAEQRAHSFWAHFRLDALIQFQTSSAQQHLVIHFDQLDVFVRRMSLRSIGIALGDASCAQFILKAFECRVKN